MGKFPIVNKKSYLEEWLSHYKLGLPVIARQKNTGFDLYSEKLDTCCKPRTRLDPSQT